MKWIHLLWQIFATFCCNDSIYKKRAFFCKCLTTQNTGFISFLTFHRLLGFLIPYSCAHELLVLFMLYYWGIHVKAVWSWLVEIDRGVVKQVPFTPYVDINLTQVRKGNNCPLMLTPPMAIKFLQLGEYYLVITWDSTLYVCGWP